MKKRYSPMDRWFHTYDATGDIFRAQLIQLITGGTVTPETVTGISPLSLVNAVAGNIQALYRYGNCVQNGTPSSSNPVDISCNNGVLTIIDDELPTGYKRIESIDFDGGFHYITGEKLYGSDEITITLDDTASGGQNVFGSYSGTASGRKNYSLYIYGGGSSTSSYLRYGETLYRPKYGDGKRTLVYGPNGASGFSTDISMTPEEFETDDVAWIGMLPNSSSPHFTGTIVGNILIGNRLKYIPCERVSDGTIGYYEPNTSVFLEPAGNGTPTKGAYDLTHSHVEVVGTPETVTITASGAASQTFTVEDLLGVGGYKDMEEVVSGVVTRKCAVCLYDGTQTIGTPYISTTGGLDVGAVIVYYTGGDTTEQVTPNELTVADGDNTVTSSVDGAEITVTYPAERQNSNLVGNALVGTATAG